MASADPGAGTLFESRIDPVGKCVMRVPGPDQHMPAAGPVLQHAGGKSLDDSDRDAIVLIASPRRLMREALVLELEAARPGVAVVGIEDLSDLPQVAVVPTVCLLDAFNTCFAEGERSAAIAALRSSWPSIRILALCRPGGAAGGRAWLKAGADGCFSTDDPPQLLLAAVGVLLAGGMFLPARLVHGLLQ
ncbi:MAG TPA: hypothetical protein VFJ18_07680 [Pararhizobium sp.]|nr:hypothetical protein [Pararhizobium sp.]